MDKFVFLFLTTVLAFSTVLSSELTDLQDDLDSLPHVRVRRTITDKDLGGFIKICKQNPVDLAFVIDASSSIWRRNFTIGLKFVQSMVRMYDISPDMVRIAVTTFGAGVYQRASFSFSRFDTQEDVSDFIGSIYYYAGSRTDTGDAIEHMRKKQMVEARKKVPHIAIVLTDGNSQRKYHTRDMAKRARESNITMIAIGVGYYVKDEELMNIAGNKTRVFRVDNYEQLETIKEGLTYQTCYKKPKPTTPAPNAEPCGVKRPSDIMFVMDQVALGQNGVGWATQFMSHTVDQEEMAKGMKMGLLSGVCPFDSGFPLRKFSAAVSLKETLHEFGSPKRLSQLVAQLPASEDYRKGARKVGVIFLGGKMDTKALLDEVEEAAASKVKLFFANTGVVSQDLLDQLSLKGTVLEGHGSRQQAVELTSSLCPSDD
ncbi:cartilage matrix protein-like [Gigantopelta aegis]|uniref:cartilage matrix protein-like n=1 Tax=Gigantopelta aegis TaxID=1735272 RepID=UPI001B8879C3|nr:cartilage matrix protein-like [Gigantopelta aegis]